MALTDKINVNLLLNASGLAIMYRKVALYDQEDVKYIPRSKSRTLNKGVGIVEIFNGAPYINDTSIMSLDISETSRLMEHPIEDGTIIADHKVILPIEITLRLVLPSLFYQGIFDQIADYFLTSKKIIIDTPTKSYLDMVLVEMPIQLKPDTIDRIPIDLHFKQVMIVHPKYIKIEDEKSADPEDSDTKNMGAKQ